MADTLIGYKYGDGYRTSPSAKNWTERFLSDRRKMGDLLSATFTHNSSLHGSVQGEDEVRKIDLGTKLQDASYPQIYVKYKITDQGFEIKHVKELFISAKERGWPNRFNKR